MSWLPVPAAAANERDALLGLHPYAYARHRAFLETCHAVTDRELLELGKARMAQVLRCREELALHSSDRLAELESWDRSPAFTDVQRTALAFVEQFIFDPSLIDSDLTRSLESALGTSGVINFATAISAYEASMRLSTLLDLEPGQ